MLMSRINQALEDCENHLAATNSYNTQIERLLTDSLLVVISAEFEQKINSIIRERFDLIEDESLRELIRVCIGTISRIRSTHMGDLLERFGADRKTAFRNEIDGSQDTERAETFYNNLIINRHDTAHGIGSNLTFQESSDSTWKVM